MIEKLNKTGVSYKPSNLEEDEENLYGALMSLQTMVDARKKSLYIKKMIQTGSAHLPK